MVANAHYHSWSDVPLSHIHSLLRDLRAPRIYIPMDFDTSIRHLIRQHCDEATFTVEGLALAQAIANGLRLHPQWYRDPQATIRGYAGEVFRKMTLQRALAEKESRSRLRMVEGVRSSQSRDVPSAVRSPASA